VNGIGYNLTWNILNILTLTRSIVLNVSMRLN